MYIRKEEKPDYPKVYNLIKEAFSNVEHSSSDEQDLVERLRKSKSFIPELSLVAIEDETIVGHILFTEARVGSNIVLALAPLSVLPEFQNRGIGKKLINHGHILAKNMGYKYSIVLGHEDYYPKSGYIPASNFKIYPPFEVDDKNFMAISFDEDKIDLDGIVEYDNAFGI